MTTTTTPTPFALDGHLIALYAQDFSACSQASSGKGRSDADWLIGLKSFSTNLSVHGDYWERHPKGDETLCLLTGKITLTLLNQGTATEQQIDLNAGQALIVPRGTWHRLSVHEPGQLLFITPVVGSEHAKLGSIESTPFVKERP